MMKLISYIFILTFFLGSCASFKKPASSADQSASTSIDYPSINPSDLAPSRQRKAVVTVKDPVAQVELISPWIFKYAILMNVPVEDLNNLKLYSFLHEWYGTPYKYGGASKKGIDCSAFTLFLYDIVYNIKIPRTSREQFSFLKRIGRPDLTEGDLVFFKEKTRITHVGVYLGNNKFAHASTSRGVMISDLDELYFSRRYAGAGRLPSSPGSVVAN